MSNEEDIVDVNTCGVCESIINHDELYEHTCFLSCASIYTNPTTRYCYPMLDDGRTIRMKVYNDKKALVVSVPFDVKFGPNVVIPGGCPSGVTSSSNKPGGSGTRSQRAVPKKKKIIKPKTAPKRKPKAAKNSNQPKKCVRLSTDEEESLILAVQGTPVLWDHRLPLEERSMENQVHWFNRIADEKFAGKYTGVTLQNKFKNLKDSYRKHLLQSLQSTGAAADPSKDPTNWIHFEIMNFLRDVTVGNCNNRATNISDESDNSNSCNNSPTAEAEDPNDDVNEYVDEFASQESHPALGCGTLDEEELEIERTSAVSTPRPLSRSLQFPDEGEDGEGNTNRTSTAVSRSRPTSPRQTRKRKRSRTESESTVDANPPVSSVDRLMTVLERRNAQLMPPPAPQPDIVDHMLGAAAVSLRRITDYNAMVTTLQEILQLAISREKEQGKD